MYIERVGGVVGIQGIFKKKIRQYIKAFYLIVKKTMLPPTFLSVLQHLLRVENQCDSSLNRFS